MTITNIVVVTEADMTIAPLYADMVKVSDKRLKAASDAFTAIAAERSDYEAKKERRKDGVIQIAQSDDIRHLNDLVASEAFLRMSVALKMDARSYIFPQSQESGKSDAETSNLKSYRKARQIAETILHGSSDLEAVARVSAVCMYHFAKNGHGAITREFCKAFLSRVEFESLDTGTAQLLADVDAIRLKRMSGGAETQSGQMVRQLVALKSAVDVRDGRNKNVALNPDGGVIRAMMVRLGQIRPEEATA